MNRAQTPQIITFGCRLNSYESEVIKSHANSAGLKDVVIFNTCAVTKEAERQAKQAIRRARRQNPNSKIVVTGCAAQIDPDNYINMEAVDHVIGNDFKLKLDTWLNLDAQATYTNNILEVIDTDSTIIKGFDGRARAIVQVQQGCDHRCTFCIIPFGRGNSRSVPIEDIIDQIKTLVMSGYKEVVMTGVDITSYGHDLTAQPVLGQMVRRVLAQVPDLPRLRLSSLDPAEIDEDLWGLIANEPRLMPYLHLSVQAGDDLILKRMKRRHLRQDIINVCDRAKSLRSDITFGADIIAGFPTETEDMFENTLEIIKTCQLTFLHVFPYSERPGTPAERMPQIDPVIRKKRAALLRESGDRQLETFLKSRIGKTETIIMEKNNIGRTEQYALVRLADNLEVGSLVQASISGVKGHFLLGHIK